jgi:hypothetical protein
MSTIKEILQKQLTEIQNTRFEKDEQFKKELSNRGMAMMRLVDLEAKNVFVEPDRIRVYMPDVSHWDSVAVYRRSNYTEGMPKYQEPKLEWKSGDTNTELELKYIMSVGKIAEHFLNKTNWWTTLVEMMDEAEAFYKSEENKTLRTQEFELEKTIRNIEQTETQDKFMYMFNKGKFKLNKSTSYTYGSGRYDFVSSDEWEWTQNGGGKIYTLHYTEKYRTNPRYDKQGNRLEAVYETRKREVPKRVRKADLEDFIKCNMNQVEG